MKIMFMGTPEISATCLKALVNGGHEVCAVVTGEDKPRGNGRRSSGGERRGPAQGGRPYLKGGKRGGRNKGNRNKE